MNKYEDDNNKPIFINDLDKMLYNTNPLYRIKRVQILKDFEELIIKIVKTI